ncbi:MAG: hypothetical protein IID41_03845 [Planctomycetes bacterium]|nr:hypothetical protein [Planctomycetota bacterium]
MNSLRSRPNKSVSLCACGALVLCVFLRSTAGQDADAFDSVSDVITAEVFIAQGHHRLILHRYSVRAADYRVFVQSADGSTVEVEPGPVRTLRGRVEGIEGSIVAGVLGDDGLRATVWMPNGERYRLATLASLEPGAARVLHVVPDAGDLSVPELSCAAENAFPQAGRSGSVQVRRSQGGACGTGTCYAELAIDSDFEFFQQWGSVPAVEDRINELINEVNIQYENEVQIAHLITAIIVRSEEDDPYDPNSGTPLVEQFRAHWLENHAGIARDLALLFTGTGQGGSAIGAVCTDLGFAVLPGTSGIPFVCATDLVAHMLGHLWGALHCDPCSGTMRSNLGCFNQFVPQSASAITAHRDSRTCLGGMLPCLGDFDGSGDVGAADLAVLLGSWGPCPGCPADLDEDAIVGASDLAILLGSWGQCP